MEGSTEGHGDVNERIRELSFAYRRDICWTKGKKTHFHFLDYI